jgi:hypothetical protein
MTDKAENGAPPNAAVWYPNSGVYFRQPTLSEYTRLMSQFQDEKYDDAQAMVSFVRSCSLSDKSDTQAFFEKHPAAIARLARALQDVAEPEAQLVVKKES